MIEFHEALQLITSLAQTIGTENVELAKSGLRVLTEDTFYDIALPPFDKSAMDGYACRSEDLANELTVIETISAGKNPENKIGKNQCAKIMTGAVVPQGADCVIMKEDIEELSENKVKSVSGKSKSNIRYVGEDVQVGDAALSKGTLLTSRHSPILASAGVANPLVFKQAKVAIFATGSELVEPSETPESYQIRNSNSYQMVSQVEELGLKGNYLGIIKDNFEETESKIAKAIDTNDVIILSGGVSVGDFDFIPLVIEKLGFEILLTRSAIQPGKPILFAKKGNTYCFGLSGNPVSSYVQFELYVKPFLLALMGHDFKCKTIKVVINETQKRKKRIV